MQKSLLFLSLMSSMLFWSCTKNDKSEAQTAEYQRNIHTVNEYHSNGNGALDWKAELDADFYDTKGSKKEVWVYVELKGKEHTQTRKRSPLNICLVLDRSGSMAGDKIRYAKEAMDFVVDQLGAEDYLSLVQYDDNVEVLIPATKVINRAEFHQKIKSIREDGSTNLCGGMEEGFHQVISTKKEGFVNRVLLLSDGLANAGISEPANIIKIAEKRFKESGVAISTFGVGADYNEDLMTDIADKGGANYYFIGQATEIPRIFSRELDGLLSVVAQSAKLRVHFPTQFVKVAKVYGYPHTVFGDDVFIDMNDVFSKEEKGVLIKFEILQAPLTTDLAFECELKYTDAIQGNTPVSEKQMLTLTMTDNPEKVKESIDKMVKENIVLFESAEMLDEALKAADDGDIEKAQEISGMAKEYLDKNAETEFSPRFQQQQSNVNTYNTQVGTMKDMPVTEQKVFQKSNKSANYEIKKKK